MDERRKIDLKQHTSPKVSKGYLLRILIYVVVMGCILAAMYYLYQQPGAVRDGDSIEEINGVTIEAESNFVKRRFSFREFRVEIVELVLRGKVGLIIPVIQVGLILID